MRFFALLLAGCSSVSEPQFIIDQPETEGPASVFFAHRQANGQYCIYRQEVAELASLTSKKLDRSQAQLLTKRSVSRDDLISASLAEMSETGTVFNLSSYAIFPGGVTCALAGGSWLAIRKTKIGLAVGGVALLSCALTSTLFASANLVQSKAEQRLTDDIDKLIDNSSHRGSGDVNRTTKDVLSWLVSENSLACNK